MNRPSELPPETAARLIEAAGGIRYDDPREAVLRLRAWLSASELHTRGWRAGVVGNRAVLWVRGHRLPLPPMVSLEKHTGNWPSTRPRRSANDQKQTTPKSGQSLI